MPNHARETLIEGCIDWQQWLSPGAASAAEFGLPEAPAVLAERLIATGAIGAFVAGNGRRRRPTQDRDDG